VLLLLLLLLLLLPLLLLLAAVLSRLCEIRISNCSMPANRSTSTAAAATSSTRAA
jgi:hypothetical protein